MLAKLYLSSVHCTKAQTLLEGDPLVMLYKCCECAGVCVCMYVCVYMLICEQNGRRATHLPSNKTNLCAAVAASRVVGAVS